MTRPKTSKQRDSERRSGIAVSQQCYDYRNDLKRDGSVSHVQICFMRLSAKYYNQHLLLIGYLLFY